MPGLSSSYLAADVSRVFDSAVAWTDGEARLDGDVMFSVSVSPFGADREQPGLVFVLTDVSDDMRVFREEIFGPVAPLFKFRTEDEAIAMASEHKPDLISLDLSMPGKDGVEAFVELRKNPETEEIPVCVVTGHPEFRQVIYDRSAPPPEGFMDKPIDPLRLVGPGMRHDHDREAAKQQ